MRFACLILVLTAARLAGGAEPVAGRIEDRVLCSANTAQSYALYLPSNYSKERSWPVLFGFDPAARGRIPVERYQAAAEQYGWIVAGSNNSRNGSWQVSTEAAQFMWDDVLSRFQVDPRRVYAAGMSGGARVALGLALGGKLVAGVIASSAGYPDATPRKTVPFALFGTAGTEDFNYLEMRRLDRELNSPHHLTIFPGGHVWLSSELATQAVEWMELQAIKTRLGDRDQARIEKIFAKRSAALDATRTDKDRYLALQAMSSDFEGLKDVSALAARAVSMGREKGVRDALKKDRQEEEREQRETDRILDAEARLASADQHSGALVELRDSWKDLASRAKGPVDSPDRRIARRMMRGLAMGIEERVKDPQYRKIVADTQGFRRREESLPPSSGRQ